MRIAIVAPSPNPFLVGGAENLLWGLEQHINQETAHVADLIKIPVRETSLADLVSGYEAFSRLDLSGFDAVISCKYPAWMVSHPYHVVDMMHCCRGFYDWYTMTVPDGAGYRGRDPLVLEFLDYLERNRGLRASLPEFFARFRALGETAVGGAEFARHPGPVGREIIRYLDGIGLATQAIKRYVAIAEAVKRRPGYFPAGANVAVAYHPTNKTGFHDAGEDYFFTVSRFYPSKRIGLLIDAYRRTDIPLPFKIAGTGDEEAKLRERAGDDRRIEFLGFVRDEELIDLYAGAMAIPFTPQDEDYGYITLEAMLSSKPVITTRDSGGPMELVRDGETGVVADPTPESLAKAFGRVYRDRDWARAIGRRGLERGRQVTWNGVLATLLGDGPATGSPDAGTQSAPRLTPRKRPGNSPSDSRSLRIAIVAPSPNPFLVGGAENLWWGMLDYLNHETNHVADLIKLPVNEASFPDFVRAYEEFSKLDLSGFDLVISTKYPAWMVSHPNHVVFLQHRCRGFYDWYPIAALGSRDYMGNEPRILELLAYIDRNRGLRASLPEFFRRFRELCDSPEGKAEFTRHANHAGPVGRAIVHYLDGIGLSRSAIRRYHAIADTVKHRPEYFPAGAEVNVVYHPTNKSGFHDAGEGYFFTASRFYPSKRIDLLIDAYRRTDIPLPFRIAGTGSEEATLRERAGDDSRIELLGFVRDEELIDLYAGAMAVPFAPADEDFGYITLEAMLSGKPVITTNDSGGPLELVRDGETGVVAEPNADSLAAAFQRVHAERDWARAIGRRGLERARQITWGKLFADLLDVRPGARPAKRRPPRPRLTVLNAYAVHPPNNGGRHRIHWLYRTLARHIDIDLVTLGMHSEGNDVIDVCEGYRELRVARTAAHEEADQAAQVRAHVPVYDITALENVGLTPDYRTVLENSLAGSRAALLSHPYMLTALRETAYAGPILHESHNREHSLKRQMLPPTAERERLLSLVEDAERHCCRDAAFVFATCKEDAQGLLTQYGGQAKDMEVIPNGTDTQGIAFAAQEKRSLLKRRLRLGSCKVALFLASGHRPNLEAAEHLFTLATRMPDVAFALVGNAADAFRHRPLPDNVWLVGVVSEEARNVWLEAADVALNPMLYGGGTNLKLLDYFAAGTPVVSTEIGIRGSGAEAGRHLIVASIEDFEPAIRTALSAGPEIGRMTAAARTLAETDFDWWKLGDRLYQAISERQLV